MKLKILKKSFNKYFYKKKYHLESLKLKLGMKKF